MGWVRDGGHLQAGDVMDETFYFSCHVCGEPRFLYRGKCQECAPEEHSARAKHEAIWDEVFKNYEQATGKKPLDDWDSFEDWLDAKWA